MTGEQRNGDQELPSRCQRTPGTDGSYNRRNDRWTGIAVLDRAPPAMKAPDVEKNRSRHIFLRCGALGDYHAMAVSDTTCISRVLRDEISVL